MISIHEEPSTVGLTQAGRAAMDRLENAGVFLRLVDAYRFAVALGLAHGAYESGEASRRTMFNVGTLDPDGALRVAVSHLRDELDEPVYRSLERYAEWGIAELDRALANGPIQFARWLLEAGEASQ